MPQMRKKTLAHPDETRTFDKGLLELVTLGGVTFGPGNLSTWLAVVHLSEAPRQDEELRGPSPPVSCFGPAARRHGRRQRAEFGPGDVSLLPPGHDAWVVGDEPVVVIDISGMGEYARPA